MKIYKYLVIHDKEIDEKIPIFFDKYVQGKTEINFYVKEQFIFCYHNFNNSFEIIKYSEKDSNYSDNDVKFEYYKIIKIKK